MKIHFNPIADNKLAYFPRKYANQAIGFYIVSLVTCSMLYYEHAMPIYILIIGIISSILFFYGSFNIGKQWSRLSEKRFIKNVFWYAFAIRLISTIVMVVCNLSNYNHYWESNPGDIAFYVPEAMGAATRNGLNIFATINEWISYKIQVSDMGYMVYLSVLYTILQVPAEAMTTAYSDYGPTYAWLPLLIKAAIGAYTCILMYRIAQRHFGEHVARMTAIFCMLQWNMIWWCGSMMKETEMIFVATLFVERMDRTISGLNIKPWFIAGTVAIGLAIFTFRSALFMTAIAATVLALALTRAHTLSTGKKVLAGIMVAVALTFAMGDTIMEEVREVVDTAQNSDYQKTNMEWRGTRSEGNQFAKYAGAAVFAPLIFTIPFPNMVYTNQDQEMLMIVNGGNFEKNILSFFIVFAMFQLLFSGQWRQHVFPIAYYVGYLAALVLSVFAQSGRFHMPILPFAMMFGAYGLTLVTSRKHKQWFSYALMAEVVICIAWSWFKLKGRGMI